MEEAQKKVVQSSQGLGSFAGATGIFGQDSIALGMEVVLNSPVATAEAGKNPGIRLSWGQTGEGKVGLLGDCTGAFVGLMAMDCHHLLWAGKAHLYLWGDLGDCTNPPCPYVLATSALPSDTGLGWGSAAPLSLCSCCIR